MTSVATITIGPNDGVGETNGKHVDYWMYASFNPGNHVSHITEIANYGQ